MTGRVDDSLYRAQEEKDTGCLNAHSVNHHVEVAHENNWERESRVEIDEEKYSRRASSHRNRLIFNIELHHARTEGLFAMCPSSVSIKRT